MEVNNSLVKMYNNPWFSKALSVTAAVTIYLNLNKQVDEFYGKPVKKAWKWTIFVSVGGGLFTLSTFSPKLGNIVSVFGIAISTLWNLKKEWEGNEAFLPNLFPGLENAAKKIQKSIDEQTGTCFVRFFTEENDIYDISPIAFAKENCYQLCCKSDHCILYLTQGKTFFKIYVKNKKIMITTSDSMVVHDKGYKVTFNERSSYPPKKLPDFKNHYQFLEGIRKICKEPEKWVT